ncbi:MAG: hypothetical protein M0Z27_05785, partial [Thermaerobacter sp.]|nr:hypothetical protein [Thermaerobacter sp.]
ERKVRKMTRWSGPAVALLAILVSGGIVLAGSLLHPGFTMPGTGHLAASTASQPPATQLLMPPPLAAVVPSGQNLIRIQHERNSLQKASFEFFFAKTEALRLRILRHWGINKLLGLPSADITLADMERRYAQLSTEAKTMEKTLYPPATPAQIAAQKKRDREFIAQQNSPQAIARAEKRYAWYSTENAFPNFVYLELNYTWPEWDLGYNPNSGNDRLAWAGSLKSDPRKGAILIWANPGITTKRGGLWVAPKPIGAITMTAVHGNIIYFKSASGTTGSYNMLTHQWTLR